MENQELSIGEAKKRGVINRSTLYSIVSAHSRKAVETLVLLLKSSNDNVRLGAARTLLDKCLPDMKAIEMQSDSSDQQKFIILAGNGFIPNVKT